MMNSLRARWFTEQFLDDRVAALYEGVRLGWWDPTPTYRLDGAYERTQPHLGPQLIPTIEARLTVLQSGHEPFFKPHVQPQIEHYRC